MQENVEKVIEKYIEKKEQIQLELHNEYEKEIELLFKNFCCSLNNGN